MIKPAKSSRTSYSSGERWSKKFAVSGYAESLPSPKCLTFYKADVDASYLNFGDENVSVLLRHRFETWHQSGNIELNPVEAAYIRRLHWITAKYLAFAAYKVFASYRTRLAERLWRGVTWQHSKLPMTSAYHDKPAQGLLFLPEPVRTHEQQFNILLTDLENRAAGGAQFGGAGESLREIAKQYPEARTWLLELAKDAKSHARLRWFAFEILQEYDLDGLFEMLAEAIDDWPEDMALLGATLALRFKKIPAALRSRVYDALIRRLKNKFEQSNIPSDVVSEQLVSHWLAALGSLGKVEDLWLIRNFWANPNNFEITLNALDAATRVIRRESRQYIVDEFFLQWTKEVREWTFWTARARKVRLENDSLLWGFVKLLAARLGDESLVLADLASEYPSLRRRLLAEVKKAQDHLMKRGSGCLTENQKIIEHLTFVLEKPS